MTRQITGVLKKPDGQTLNNTEVILTAISSTDPAMIETAETSFTTDGAGVYDVTVENGYYRVMKSDGVSRYIVGNILVEDGAAITLPELLAIDAGVI